MKKTTSIAADAPTIDGVSGGDISNLIAYWKVSDISDGVVRDYSGNGFHLTLTCTKESQPIGSDNCEDGYTLIGGHLSLDSNWALMRDVSGTALDTGSNYIVYGCELLPQAASDDDFGTAWAGGHAPSDADTFSGFQIGGFGATVQSARILWNDGAQRFLQAGVKTTMSANDSIVYAAGWIPGATGSLSVAYSHNGADVVFDTDSTPSGGTIPDSLTAQSDKFALRATTATGQGTPIRNYYVWSFSSEPIYMNATIKWLAANPGKIPPWWM